MECVKMQCPDCKCQNPEYAIFCNGCGCHLIGAEDNMAAMTVIGSERKHVTVMFCDMSGYTAMTESLDPEDVKEIMSQIFGKITQIIRKYDGFIERFVGDAVMAVFGVPKTHEDDPIRAIRAALEVHATVEKLSPQFEDRIGRPLSMHTGINTGLVVTGEVDIEKGKHGLTGDAINLASRLENIADAGEIITGQDTYFQSLNFFKFEELEPTIVKGKTEPINVYKVLGPVDRSDRNRRMQGV